MLLYWSQQTVSSDAVTEVDGRFWDTLSSRSPTNAFWETLLIRSSTNAFYWHLLKSTLMLLRDSDAVHRCAQTKFPGGGCYKVDMRFWLKILKICNFKLTKADAFFQNNITYWTYRSSHEISRHTNFAIYSPELSLKWATSPWATLRSILQTHRVYCPCSIIVDIFEPREHDIVLHITGHLWPFCCEQNHSWWVPWVVVCSM